MNEKNTVNVVSVSTDIKLMSYNGHDNINDPYTVLNDQVGVKLQ